MKGTDEKAEVSEHMLLIWKMMRESDQWYTNKEISQKTGVSPRTVRSHTKYFRDLGLLDVCEVFPAHMCKLSERSRERNPGFFDRMDRMLGVIEDKAGR